MNNAEFEFNCAFGFPVNYKGLDIYPVRMKDSLKFEKYITCLLLDKNQSRDINIIKMSNLRFIMFLFHCDNKNYGFLIEYFEKLIDLFFKEKVIFKEKKGSLYFSIKDIELHENELDKIKEIIFNQNLLKLPEKIEDSELEKSLREAKEFMAARNKSATLEERIISYHISTGINYNNISELTIYQFNKGIERLNLLKDFEVYTYPALKGGQGEKIKHWLSHIPEKGLYDDVCMSVDELKNNLGDSANYV